jgi:cell division septation protein DedD
MNSPDRRPVLYVAVGAVILVLAFLLFRPNGGDNDLPDTMVLTPHGTDDAELQASVDEGESIDNLASEVAARAETVDADPFPVEDATLESAELSTPAQKVAEPVKTSPRARTAVATPALGGEYYVVVGSYGDPANAQRLVQRLDASGIAAEIFSGPGASGTLHRVRVGYFVDHSRAEAFGRKLQKDMSLDFWVGHR